MTSRFLTAFALIGSLICIQNVAYAQSTNSYTLRVLSYNIKAMPAPFAENNNRYERIGEILAERRVASEHPQVVMFQEDFEDRTDRIYRAAGHPYIVKGPKKKSKIFNSGLTILSDYKFLNKQSKTYKKCATWDCFSRKGAVTVLVHPEGMPEPFWIGTTHMQSQSEHDKVREKQLKRLYELLDKDIRYQRNLTILAGDFNFKPHKHRSYWKFMGKGLFDDVGGYCAENQDLCEITIGQNSKTSFSNVYKNTNDRHFLYVPQNGPYKVEVEKFIINMTEEHSHNHYLDGYLSDHWGYEVHYKISW